MGPVRECARARALSLFETDYYRVATSVGHARPRILVRHHLPPNESTITLSCAISKLVAIVLCVAALSPSATELNLPPFGGGVTLSQRRVNLIVAEWPIISSGVLRTITAVVIGLIAKGATDGTVALSAA